MSVIGTSEGASAAAEMPVEAIEDVKFPPFPDPVDRDFDEDLSVEEKNFYKEKFPDLNAIVNVKLHCTACDRHLGCSAKNESRMRPHPMLRTLICHTCHSFYNSGEFDRGEDGSELYCRWCGQGGQVYCCSDCIHVFCAKCIKRNLGIAKIKEIENTDDWKCFKCNPKCLWEMRAVCWALLRFCDLRNKVVFHTSDPELKEKYQKAISIDSSECCKNKGRRKEKVDSAKKKEKEKEKEKETDSAKKIVPKFPPTIQVKKFASINLDDTPKIEKKAQKRSASPKNKIGFIQKPIAIAPCNISTPPMMKKIRLPNASMLNPVRYSNDKKLNNSYTRVPNRPRQPYPIPIVNPHFNGLSHPFSVSMSNLIGDNINLSLETLTQGLDMAAVAAYNNNAPPVDNDVVCTPDFPLEPLCEVTEDNDDDVECITPGPLVAPPKISNPPPLVPRSLPELSNDNIVQMTENDVTVNALTGGLKFRVDPQTLSSKKMYRLPDGRIFAINPNPNMPGGYSATIVSVSDTSGKVAPKGGETYAAKLSAITTSSSPSSSNTKTPRNTNTRKAKTKSTPRARTQKAKEPSNERRVSDLKVPVEWYRYNLIDAVDALDYSLSRLNKLKKEATTAHLRTRNVDEIKYLHRTLEQLLTTSSKRFLEIRDSLNKELKLYISRKSNQTSQSGDDVTEDDDDVEFLPNAGNDDPIFIDENSMDSVNGNESQEVDLTGAASSEHNDSTENKNFSDPLLCHETVTENDKNDNSIVNCNNSVKEVQSPGLLNLLLGTKHDKDTTNIDSHDADENKNENEDKQDEETDKSDDKTIAGSDDKRNTESTEKHDLLADEQEDETAKDDTNNEVDTETEKTDNDVDTEKEDNSKSSTGAIIDKKINGENDTSMRYNSDSMDVDTNELNVSKVKDDPDDEQAQVNEVNKNLIKMADLLKSDTRDG